MAMSDGVCGRIIVVYGDLVEDKLDVKYVIQQINCLAVKSHGLSASLSESYPYSDTYYYCRQKQMIIPGHLYNLNLASHTTRGTPGEIDIRPPPNVNNGPVFVNLMGTVCAGVLVFKF